MRSSFTVFSVSLFVACANPQQPQSGTGGGGGQLGVGGGESFGGGGGGFQGDGGGFEGDGGGPGCFVPADNGAVVAQVSPPAISGGTMAVLQDGTVVIGDSDRDQLHIVAPNFAVSHVQLSPKDEPGRVVAGPGTGVFVSLRGAGQVAQVDVSSGAVTRLDACAAPRGLAWKSGVSQLLVACSSGELATIDLSSGSPVKTVTHPVDDLRDVVVLNGQTLVTTFRSAQVFAIADDGTPTAWSRPAAFDSADGSGRHFTPQVAWRTIGTPQGGLLMVHQFEEVTAIPAPSPCVSTYGSPGFALQPTLGGALSWLNALSATDEMSLPAAALPVDVALADNGARVAVAFAGSTTLAYRSPDLVQNPTLVSVAGQPVSVAFSGSSLLIFSREPARLIILDSTATETAELPLSTVSMASTGHDLFHLQTQNGVACASCHPEAGDDGHVWNLPEGVRRTPSLRGGLSGTEPFHWSGEEPNIDQLMSDVFVSRMGGATESTDRTAALLAWLDLQPTRPAPGDLDPASVARGAASWNALGCVACHAGALGTNNSSVDVGTGEVLQVPRLVELAYRAPYFHDGRLGALADRFTPLGGAGHTATSGLTADQIADLVEYLKSR